MYNILMFKINSIEKDSVAEELGIVPGDFLIGFDGQPYADMLDLLYYESQEEFILNIKKADGELIDFEIEKDESEILGISVDDPFHTRVCRNKCVFCFVGQLPCGKDVRQSLKLKDDDWRMSAVYGNFVTLTNLQRGELERIISKRISPLYISVHSCDPDIRAKMLGNPDSDIMPIIRRLSGAGIRLHTQIVLCPGYNTGADMINSITALEPLCESLAVVPVGLTKFSNGLRALTKEEALEAVQHIEYFQRAFLAQSGRRFCFAADELYIAAGLEIPDAAEYEAFSQVENGVGMAAKLIAETKSALLDFDGDVSPREVTLVTGRAAHRIISALAAEVTAGTPVKAEVIAVKNDYFGESVTVSGLVTGGDIAAQVKDKIQGEVLIPCNMLREFEDVFLDGMTLGGLQDALGAKIKVVDSSGEDFVRKILTEE